MDKALTELICIIIYVYITINKGCANTNINVMLFSSLQMCIKGAQPR